MGQTYERLWLSREAPSSNGCSFRVQPGRLQLAKGTFAIGLGILIEATVSVYFVSEVQRVHCIVPAILGIVCAVFGLNSVCPRRGFAIDRTSQKVRVWGIRWFYRREAEFDFSRFCRIRLSLFLAGGGYSICLIDKDNSVLKLVDPQYESDAIELTEEIAGLINIPISDERHSPVKTEWAFRFLRKFSEKELFKCNE